MIQHNLVKFQASEKNNNIAEYSMIPHNVYCLLRYPKYSTQFPNQILLAFQSKIYI